jgi:hypothetical protein
VTRFCLGIACGAALVAVAALVGSHVFMEISDGRLAEW